MIIQGSNNPLVIQFDADVSGIPTLVVSLWCDMAGYFNKPLKTWERSDMTINGDTAACDITEQETRNFPSAKIILEAKGLDGDGNTVFWDAYPVDIKTRHDKIITLTQTGGG